MSYESWDDHRIRLEAERAKAEAENLCPEETNEWARYDTYRSEKHKICLRKYSPDAVQLGLKLCGMHLRIHRKAEAEGMRLARERAEARKNREVQKAEEDVKHAQEKAILAELERHGVTGADLTRPWRFNSRTKKTPWTVTLPLDVLWKVIDVLPMLDPDEAVEVHRQKLAAQEKPKGEEAPF